MSSSWYYKTEGVQVGPISAAEMRGKALAGVIQSETLVRKEAEGEWIPAKRVTGLFPAATEETFDPYYEWLGIPREEQPPNLYRLLGLCPLESNANVIANAADRQMAHVRTHQGGPHSDQSQRLLNELAGARVCLLNVEKKAAYDATLCQELCAGADRDATPPTRAPWSQPWLLAGVAGAAVLLVAIVVVVAKLVMTGPSEDLASSDTEPAATSGSTDLAGLPPERPRPTVVQPGDPPSQPLPSSQATPVGGGEPLAAATASAPDSAPGKSIAPAASGRTPPASPTPSSGMEKPGGVLPAARPEPAPDAALKRLPPAGSDAREPATPAAQARDVKRPAAAISRTDDADEEAASGQPREGANHLRWLEQILKKQLALLEQWEEVKKEMENLESKAQPEKAKLAQLQDAARLNRVQAQQIRATLADLEQQTGKRMGNSPQLALLDTQYSRLLAEAGVVNRGLFQLGLEAQNLQKRADQQVQEADRLGEAWLALCDPFGRRKPEAQQRAVEWSGRHITQENRLILLYLTRAFAQVHLKEYEAALADFDRVAELNPGKRSLVTAIRAFVLSKQGEKSAGRALSEALASVKARRGQRPPADTGPVHLFCAAAYAQQQKYADAMREFDLATRALKKSPEAYEAYALLLATCPRQSLVNPKKAVQMAETACSLAKVDQWRYADTHAICLAAAGDFSSAAEWGDKALESAPAEQQPAVRERRELYRQKRPYRPPDAAKAE